MFRPTYTNPQTALTGAWNVLRKPAPEKPKVKAAQSKLGRSLKKKG